MFLYKKATVKIDDARIEYIAFGKGEPLLIIPGIGDGLHTVHEQALFFYFSFRDFKKSFHVIVMSRRHLIPQGFSTQDMARDYVQAMDALGFHHFFLLGGSMGGAIAQHIAINYPKQVRKFVLASTFARLDEQGTKIIDTWILMARQGRFKDLRSYTFEKALTKEEMKKPLAKLFRRGKKPRSFERYIRQAEAVRQHNTLDQLEKIRCPVLVIHGDKDQLARPALVREMAERLRDCKQVTLKDTGHVALGERRKEFMRAVLEFLTTLGSADQK